MGDIDSGADERFTRWGWNRERSWWRRVLAFPLGRCICLTHDPDDCDATWRHPVEW